MQPAEGIQYTDTYHVCNAGKAFPTTVVTRIMRLALPPHLHAKIAGDAKDAIDWCVAEFAAVVTRQAAQVCKEDRRSILTGDDLISAMGRLGFDDYVGPLAAYLRRYRESGDTVPRGRQPEQSPAALGRAQEAPAAAVTTVEMPPPSGFALGRPPCDVTELGLHTDVYAVWFGAAAAASTSDTTWP